MRRFEIGQLARIRDVICSKYSGNTGIVRAVSLNKRDTMSLDKYVVEFRDGTRSEFLSIQLIPTGGQYSNMPEAS